ncbi:MAG: glycosyltransferase family 1 protein [Naasia sp.]
MITLRVVADSVLEQSPRGIARYTEELTRALVETAPRDCEVAAVVSGISGEEEQSLRERIPGLSSVTRLPLGRRELRTAWQHGLTTRPLGGMVHAPSLLAPLVRHDRRRSPGEQTVVTIHDASAWLHPEDDAQSAWIRGMAKRARKHADAVVVPTHAVADALSQHLDLGDRIRVIGGAVSSSLALPADPEGVADRLGLPADYVLAVGTLAPRKGLDHLMRAAASAAFPDLPLLIVGPEAWHEQTMSQAVFQSGAPEGRIRLLGTMPDDDLAVVIDRATAVAVPSLHEGFGLPAIEALHFGTPLIHSDAPALSEVVAGAGVEVPLERASDYAERLALAIADTVGDSELLRRLSIQGRDRAQAFSWRDSAERTWQLHAEL